MKKSEYTRTLYKNGKTYPETRRGYEFKYFRTIGGTWAYYPTGSITAATPDGTGAKITLYIEKIGGFWRTTEKNTGLWSGKEYDTLKQAAAGTVELLDLMWEVLERRRAASLPVEV